MKIFKKKPIALSLATLILLASCSQYDVNSTEQSFDYSLYEQVMNTKFQGDYSKTQSELENSKEIIKTINNELNITLDLPDEALTLHDYTFNEVQQIGLQKGYFKPYQIPLMNKFVKNLKTLDFETALSLYEMDVLDLNLSNEEFQKQNAFVNIIKAIKYYKTDLNGNSDIHFYKLNNCEWELFVAYGSVVGAVGSCVIVWTCVLGIVLAADAVYNFTECTGG